MRDLRLSLVATVSLWAGLLYCSYAQALLVEDLPTSASVDSDLVSRGNWQLVTQRAVDYQYQEVTIAGSSYRIGVFFNSPINEQTSAAIPTYLVLHDNEDAAFDSGLQRIADNGGIMWVLENKESRFLYDQTNQQFTSDDPNRLFWGMDEDTAQVVTLPLDSDNMAATYPRSNANADFARFLLEKIGIMPAFHPKSEHRTNTTPANTLIALHNNSPSSRFGMAYLQDFIGVTAMCESDPEPKNLFWLAITEERLINDHHSHTQLVNGLCQSNQVNVVQEITPSVAQGDGSLSVYMANHAKDWQYVNIEIKAAIPNSEDEQRAKNQQLDYLEILTDVMTQSSN